MIIFIELTGSKHAKEMGGMISESLTREGYVIGKAPDYADVVIKGSLEVEPVELDNPKWEFARATASLVIIDRGSGLKVGEIVENKRAAHIRLSEASHKATIKVSRLLAEKLSDYFGDGQ